MTTGQKKPPTEVEGTTSSNNHSQGKATTLTTHINTRKLAAKKELTRLAEANDERVEEDRRRAEWQRADLAKGHSFSHLDLFPRLARTFHYEVENGTAFVGANRVGGLPGDDLVNVIFSDSYYELVPVAEYVALHGTCGIESLLGVTNRRPVEYMLARGVKRDGADTRTYWPVHRTTYGRLATDEDLAITPEYRRRWLIEQPEGVRAALRDAALNRNTDTEGEA